MNKRISNAAVMLLLFGKEKMVVMIVDERNCRYKEVKLYNLCEQLLYSSALRIIQDTILFLHL